MNSSGFESSLRSSPKIVPKKSAKDASLPLSPSAPLKHAILGQHANDATKLVESLSAIKPPVVAVDSIARVWEPPLSCQRAAMSELSAGNTRSVTHYFPLEVTAGEYVSRAMRLLSGAVSAVCEARGYPDQPRSDAAATGNVAMLIVLLGHYSKTIRTALEKHRPLLLADIKSISGVEEHAGVLVSAHERESSVPTSLPANDSSDSHAGRLGDLANVFSAARAIASGMLNLCTNAPKLVGAVAVVTSVAQGLEQLEQLHRLHRVFKDQRMASLGWLWPSATHPADLRASFSKSQSFDFTGTGLMGGQNGESKADAEEQQRWDRVRAEAEEVMVQLQALLQPTTLANVQLFHRLVSIVQDLDVLMRALSADSEYQEAQRLRELKAVVDNTVTPQGRALLDQVKQCCTQAQMLVSELRRFCEDCKARGGYYQLALQFEQTARDLNSMQRELRTNGISPFSLLSQTSVVERLSREGSAFVTSDFLFSEPHQQQVQRVVSAGNSGDMSPSSPVHQQLQAAPSPFNPASTLRVSGGAEGLNTGTAPISIGSLVIRAGSNAVLNAIRATWPGLTALNRGGVLGAASMVTSPGAPSPNTSRWAQQQQQQQQVRDVDEATGILSPSSIPAQGWPREFPSAASTGGGLLSPIPHSTGPLPPAFSHTGGSLGGSASYASRQTPPVYPPRPQSRTSRSEELPPDFNPAESYNEVGFSPTILSVLMSFEELQQQLHVLLSPAAIALTQLVQRFVGFSADLLHLSERCHRSGQYSEGDRLLNLRAVIEATIDADHQDAAHELVCGRGRRRLDNLQVLLQQVQVGSRELQRLAMRSRAESDFTGAQALDEVAADLTRCMGRIETSLSEGVFSMLDTEHGVATPEQGLEISEHIAREGTGFITSDYIFHFASGREGHSIGSLAIIAGAGAVLRFIRAEWPELTALSAPLYGQPQLPSHGHEGQWGDLTFEVESKAAAAAAAAGASPLQDSVSGALNFRDAASLRMLGFDAASLRLAGFSDIAVVTAGYTAAELRDANFSTEQLRQAGLSESALRVVGFQTEQQADVLASLFRATEGGKWKDAQGWRDLLKAKRVLDNTPAHLLPVASAAVPSLQQQQSLSQRFLLAGLHGVKCDENSGEVIRINLSANNLIGQLPSGIGSLASLTQLVLSNNQLSGVLPSSLGLLVNLENLHLDGNNFEGEIPRSLKSLEHLVVLKLERNKLSGTIPAVLGGLHRLRRLDLSQNALTGSIPPRLAQLSSLQELLLHDNQLSGCLPEAIGQLVNLTSLQLQNNCLQGYVPASIARLTKLTGLNIQRNPDLTVDRLQLQRALPRCRIKM